MSAKKHERTDRRSADLLITVSKLCDEIRIPPHNKTNWTSTTRSYIFSGEHEKIAARAQVLLEPRGQRHNSDDAVNSVSRRTDQFAAEVGGSNESWFYGRYIIHKLLKIYRIIYNDLRIMIMSPRLGGGKLRHTVDESNEVRKETTRSVPKPI